MNMHEFTLYEINNRDKANDIYYKSQAEMGLKQFFCFMWK